MRIFAALALTLLVTACANGPGTDCAGFSPIRPTKADVEVISDPLAAEILAHNEFGRERCGSIDRAVNAIPGSSASPGCWVCARER